jgi:hypothetical protein
VYRSPDSSKPFNPTKEVEYSGANTRQIGRTTTLEEGDNIIKMKKLKCRNKKIL